MSTRTRNKGSLNPEVQGTCTWSSTQPFNNGLQATIGDANPNDRTLNDTRESMTDVADSPGAMHNVTHNKTRAFAGLLSAQYTFADPRPSPIGGGSRSVSVVVGDGPYLALSMGHLTVPNGQALAIARVPSLAKESVSLLNTLYELKDLRGTFQRIAEHLAWARFRAVTSRNSGRGNPNGIDDYLFQEFIRGISKATSSPVAMIKFLTGFDLAWKFGWKPLLADIQKVHSVLGSIQDKYDQLVSQEFSCVGMHKEQKEEGETTLNAYVRPEFPVFKRTRVRNKTTTVTWYAGVKRKLSPTAILFPDKVKRALAREQLGLDLNASVVWEAIPFSFVVDWVLPINNFLEQFNGSPVDPGLVITGQKWLTTKSVTTARIATTIVPHPPTYATLQSGKAVYGLSEGTKTSYVRTTPGSWTLPPLYVPELRLPNLGQSWTGLELLVQRFKSLAR